VRVPMVTGGHSWRVRLIPEGARWPIWPVCRWPSTLSLRRRPDQALPQRWG